MRLSLALVSAAALFVAARPAFADTNASANWAGYSIHGVGVQFTKVDGQWREPSAICRRGRRTYSAFWIGLGGYSQTSNALEQIGTEVDCSASGTVRSSAWYELVPSASRTIHFSVQPGDLINADVTVVGQEVDVSLYNATTNRWFRKALHARALDLTSADWIAEAPSDCIGTTNCQTLPLANFRSATFLSASAQSTTGHVGTISDPAWSATRIELRPAGRRFAAYHGSGQPAGAAIPSALGVSGAGFTVHYVTARAAQFASVRQAFASAGRVLHRAR